MEVLKGLELISQGVGNDPSYTQGGGGNTSAKLDNEVMAIKASGFRLNQINTQEGYVLVNYKNIRQYFEDLDVDRHIDIEKEGSDYIKANIIQEKNPKKLRPSVETGFHSILDDYVIHTHSVYANILCCTTNGKTLMETIFQDSPINCIWVPYTHPGVMLTTRILKASKQYKSLHNKSINAVFMENHGVIVTGDDASKCLELHDLLNKKIRYYFSLTEQYPSPSLQKLEEEAYISKCPYLIDHFKGNVLGPANFSQDIYPDHIVYLGDDISFDGGESKIDIDSKSGIVTYRTTLAYAMTAEENLIAYLYVLNSIKRLGLEVKTMDQRYVDLIRNWESEAYRRQLMKELKE